MSRNLSNCYPNAAADTDLPQGWEQNNTLLCGISWPSETPWTNMSNCCSGPVHVWKGCLQWCATNYDINTFTNCAVDSIANVSAGGAICNGNFAGRTTVSSGLAASALMLWVLLHSIL